MTPTAENALRLRIANRGSAIAELIDTVIRMPDVPVVIFDALDRRILDESGDYVPWLTLVPYLLKYRRHALFDTLSKDRPPSDWELAQLFKAGYGNAGIESKLCATLYEVFRSNDNPRRRLIVEALQERGGAAGLRMLEVVRYELEPDVKTRRVLATPIAQAASVDGEDFLYVIATRSLIEFATLVGSAIDEMRSRGVTPDGIEPPPAPITSAEAESPGHAAPLRSAAVAHSRLSRVEHYFSRAKDFVAKHPSEALNNMRKAAEAICKDLLDETIRTGGGEGKQLKPAKAYASLEEMLSEVRRRRLSPIDIEKCLASLQSFGNFGSHDHDFGPGNISCEMAKSILIQLKIVIDWYKVCVPVAGSDAADK